MDDIFFNCYYIGSGNAAAPADNLVGLTDTTLQGNDAIGAMSGELMGVNSQSGVNVVAEYGSAIMYVADAAAFPNNRFPVYGTAHLVTVEVVGGVGFGEATLADAAGIYPVSAGPEGSLYYVANDTTPTLSAKALVTLTGAEYDFTGIANPATALALTTKDSTATQTFDAAVTAAKKVSIEFIPETYTLYKVDLATSETSASFSSASGSKTVTFDTTTGNR